MKKLVQLTLFTVIAFCSFSQYQIGHTTPIFNDPARTGGFESGGGSGRQIQTEIIILQLPLERTLHLPQVISRLLFLVMDSQ
jgi:hypothetical protein